MTVDRTFIQQGTGAGGSDAPSHAAAMIAYARLHGRAIAVILILAGAALWLVPRMQRAMMDAGPCDDFPAQARIDPDYAGIMIPPNIAPLNFRVLEPGSAFRIALAGAQGKPLTVWAMHPEVHLPFEKWRRILRDNQGRDISLTIAARQSSGRWQRFRPATLHVSTDEIDGYLTYRRIDPGFTELRDMEIRERALSGFHERSVLHNRTLSATTRRCLNCHSPWMGDPRRMVLHVRGGKTGGMLLADGNLIVNVDTRTGFNKSPASYTAWHPDGKHLAFAVMKIHQWARSVGEVRVVADEWSDLIIYSTDDNTIHTHPEIASRDRMETQPDWAPDGRHLYFASAPQITFSDTFTSERRYRDVRYDLMRVEYDPASGQWGKAEPVLTAAEAGGSLSGPKVSPDGRFLLFVMLDFGYFSLYSREADLYLMDLATRSYRRLDEVNSKESESFHAWSSNSRWFVFASRRRDGLCGLPYFAHVDEKGNASKAFLLPQKDPGLYEKQLKSFNIPILASAPVRQGWRRLAAAATGRCRNVNARLDSKVRVDAATGATP